jgi:hypothetical protein
VKTIDLSPTDADRIPTNDPSPVKVFSMRVVTTSCKGCGDLACCFKFDHADITGIPSRQRINNSNDFWLTFEQYLSEHQKSQP